MTKEEAIALYNAAAHAMQTGVAADHASGGQDGTPKHLRVGINSAMSDHSSLAGLLIKKGLITEEEYLEAIAEGMEKEAAMYEKKLGVKLA